MKKLSVFITILAILLPFSAFSQEGNAQFATIDIDRISKEAKVVKDIAKQIKNKRDNYQKEITKEERSLEKEKDKLEAKKSVLSEEALKKEHLAFFKKVEKLKKDANKKDKILKDAYTKSIAKVNDIVGEIVDEVAKEKKLLLVLPSSQVVYSVKGLDITEEVIDRLDDKISRIKVRF